MCLCRQFRSSICTQADPDLIETTEHRSLTAARQYLETTASNLRRQGFQRASKFPNGASYRDAHGTILTLTIVKG